MLQGMTTQVLLACAALLLHYSMLFICMACDVYQSGYFLHEFFVYRPIGAYLTSCKYGVISMMIRGLRARLLALLAVSH
jgi:hypothetical protein